MGLFDLVKIAAANMAGIKALQSGSNILVNKHTERLTTFVESIKKLQVAVKANLVD